MWPRNLRSRIFSLYGTYHFARNAVQDFDVRTKKCWQGLHVYLDLLRQGHLTWPDLCMCGHLATQDLLGSAEAHDRAGSNTLPTSSAVTGPYSKEHDYNTSATDWAHSSHWRCLKGNPSIFALFTFFSSFFFLNWPILSFPIWRGPGLDTDREKGKKK